MIVTWQRFVHFLCNVAHLQTGFCSGYFAFWPLHSSHQPDHAWALSWKASLNQYCLLFVLHRLAARAWGTWVKTYESWVMRHMSHTSIKTTRKRSRKTTATANDSNNNNDDDDDDDDHNNNNNNNNNNSSSSSNNNNSGRNKQRKRKGKRNSKNSNSKSSRNRNRNNNSNSI